MLIFTSIVAIQIFLNCQKQDYTQIERFYQRIRSIYRNMKIYFDQSILFSSRSTFILCYNWC